MHLRVGVKEFLSVASLEQKLIVEGAGRFRPVGVQGLLGACKASVNGLWREVSLQIGDRVRWFLFHRRKKASFNANEVGSKKNKKRCQTSCDRISFRFSSSSMPRLRNSSKRGSTNLKTSFAFTANKRKVQKKDKVTSMKGAGKPIPTLRPLRWRDIRFLSINSAVSSEAELK